MDMDLPEPKVNPGEPHPTLGWWKLSRAAGFTMDMWPPSEPFCWVRIDGVKTQTFNDVLCYLDPAYYTGELERLDHEMPRAH